MSGAAKSIRALRSRRSLTQRVLADRCEIVQPVIAAYESGARDPGLRNLERIAESLDARIELVTFVDVTALLEEYHGVSRRRQAGLDPLRASRRHLLRRGGRRFNCLVDERVGMSEARKEHLVGAGRQRYTASQHGVKEPGEEV